ncbi:major facilitator superfamily domain-containing protein [Irpex rosettiformis]|uniref:Major facilitator superfamily domain-containing protein n=1 Tax=Irpex rosettiformis TaxID=378272 RepID=A0ACB8TTP8_9APHY|nr:major facilitator superfamily domain-containing protein [Irpex rosettiformis]
MSSDEEQAGLRHRDLDTILSDEMDEGTPLLSQVEDSLHEVHEKESRLPIAQLVTVYLIKLTIPVVSFQAQPYINKMVSEMDLPTGRPVGYYTGLLGFAHSLGQILTVFPWGRLSDWFGRKKIIAYGIFSLTLVTIVFGLSKTFVKAALIRFLIGVFSGFIGAIHSVVGELSDGNNQSTAFPLYDSISALGFIVGPLLGGAFADPATELPRWFNTPFWRKYPYALPGFVSGLLGIGSFLLTVFYLKETHPGLARKTRAASRASSRHRIVSPSPGPSRAITQEAPPSIPSLLSLPEIRAICVSQWVIGFLAGSFNSVFVLLAYTPIEQGGLGMPPLRIAFALSIMGFVSIGLKASLPIFLRRYDTLSVYRFTVGMNPVTFALLPVLNIIAQATGPDRSAAGEALLWVAISIVLFMSRINTLAFGIIMILTKDHTPTSTALGTTNSISELAQMIGGSIGVPVVSSLFSWSTTTAGSILGGHLWIVVYVVIAFAGEFSARRIAKYRH